MAVDEKCRRKAPDPAESFHDIFITDHYRVLDVQLLDAGSDLGVGSGLHGNAQHLETLPAIPVVQRIPLRDFLQSRFAPSRPEVDEGDVPRKRSVGEGGSVQRAKSERRHALLILGQRRGAHARD
jgi:hypothetical protein